MSPSDIKCVVKFWVNIAHPNYVLAKIQKEKICIIFLLIQILYRYDI